MTARVVRRNTPQREAVRVALTEVEGFVSAQALHEALRGQGSTVGLATVYRQLAALAQDGEADTLQSPEGENLFRSCETTGHHHHLICRNCGSTHELEAHIVEQWANRVGAEYGFTDIDHTVDLFGLCPDCQAAQNAGGAASA